MYFTDRVGIVIHSKDKLTLAYELKRFVFNNLYGIKR